MNFQLPMILYRQKNSEVEKISQNSKFEHLFRRIALILLVISGLLLVISLCLGSLYGSGIKRKMPEILHPKLCQFRKCNDFEKNDENMLLFITKPSLNKTP